MNSLPLPKTCSWGRFNSLSKVQPFPPNSYPMITSCAWDVRMGSLAFSPFPARKSSTICVQKTKAPSLACPVAQKAPASKTQSWRCMLRGHLSIGMRLRSSFFFLRKYSHPYLVRTALAELRDKQQWRLVRCFSVKWGHHVRASEQGKPWNPWNWAPWVPLQQGLLHQVAPQRPKPVLQRRLGQGCPLLGHPNQNGNQ